MNTIIYTQNEYLLLKFYNCKENLIKDNIINLNATHPQLCNIYPLHLHSNNTTVQVYFFI